MSDADEHRRPAVCGRPLVPAQPLWRLAPTRDRDGRGVADFMMLIPRLGERPAGCRERVESAVREVCESFGEQVVFADLNHAINVLWISVDAQPGLTGRVARSIRERIPEALLVGGQLGAVTLPTTRPRGARLWERLCSLARRRLPGTLPPP